VAIQQVEWTEHGRSRTALWRSESGARPPRRLVPADDRLRAADAYRLACGGTAMLWHGDYHNARQLLSAMARQIDRRRRATPTFDLYRMAQAQRAHTLAMLLIPLTPDYTIPLRRAPDVRQACLSVYGPATAESVVSLRELLGLIGAHEWRGRGVEVSALGARIHPHYGVFSPVRGEYVDLVAAMPLPDDRLAFDIGTGTGVLAAVLIRRGVERVVATESDPRALACARENIALLGMTERITVREADLFPSGRAPVVVCNPPWIPARPTTPIEHAIYDQGGRMLHRFLDGLPGHLTRNGEGWLILSDIAEHLGLRSRAELLDAFETAGLRVKGRRDIKPRHPKAFDKSNPLHAARAAETTSLWRLAHA
jgi:methylase of polypeptide subunit release factors